MSIRKEFTGMLPAAIQKFEELMEIAEELNPQITKGYDSTAGIDSYFYWGCACQITCSDMVELKDLAESIGIIWADDNSGQMAYTNGLDINDFKTYRVNGQLELTEAIKIGE